MSRTADFIYENAPLVEVIAEIRWRLVPITSMPGAELDPVFERNSTKFAHAIGEQGFLHVERLVPENVPNEMLARQPLFRFRRAPGRWPLVQLGPGLFTVNITPPYEGWEEFKRTLKLAVEALNRLFPLGSDFVKVDRLELRYIDAFTERHGVRSVSDFITQHLSTPVGLPPRLVAELQANGAEIEPRVDIRFPLRDRPGDTFFFRAAPGASDGKVAVILDLRSQRSVGEDEVSTTLQILQWWDDAHKILHSAFESTISDGLREMIGPQRPVRD